MIVAMPWKEEDSDTLPTGVVVRGFAPKRGNGSGHGVDAKWGDE